MARSKRRRQKPDLTTADGAQENFLRMLRSAENEDFLGIVIRGHVLLEATIRVMFETALQYRLSEETNSRALNLRLRSELCVALGLMDSVWINPIKAVLELRNEFAHAPSYDVTKARVGGLVGSLPDLGKDIYKAIGQGKTQHMRLINFFMTLVIALNTHISMLNTRTEYERRKARQGRPPDETILRAMINVRNTTFQIPDLIDGKKIGRPRTLPT